MTCNSSPTVAPIPAGEVIKLCLQRYMFLQEVLENKKQQLIQSQRKTIFSRFFDSRLTDEELFDKRIAPGNTACGMSWDWFLCVNYRSDVEDAGRILQLAKLAKQHDENAVVYLSGEELSELLSRTY